MSSRLLTRRKIIKAGIASLVGVSIWGMNRTGNGVFQPDSLSRKKTAVNSSVTDIEVIYESNIRDQLNKSDAFDENHVGDIWLDEHDKSAFKKTLARLKRVQHIVGYANFNLVGFDEMLLYAKRFSEIGEFTAEEISFMEKIFFDDVSQYGFKGEKVMLQLTDLVDKSGTTKIAGSGHYLYKGAAQKKYSMLKRDVGEQIILTSGVRSIVKQMHLFLAKLEKSNGNLSLASRSLAPPGHSFHGIGDFDVGRRGLGKNNFTAEFAKTDEFKRLCELDYIDIRYTKSNQFGVRYEPWHIKVI